MSTRLLRLARAAVIAAAFVIAVLAPAWAQNARTLTVAFSTKGDNRVWQLDPLVHALWPIPVAAFSLILGQRSISGSPTGSPVAIDCWSSTRAESDLESIPLSCTENALAKSLWKDSRSKPEWELILIPKNAASVRLDWWVGVGGQVVRTSCVASSCSLS
jgi:hypothetical protein